MGLKIFFADYCEDKILEARDARESSKEDILHSMDCVLHMPRNFLGIIDEDDATLQFMVNDDRTIHVDVPIPAEQGSYSKTAELKECLEIVQNIRERIVMQEIDGLEFELW